LWFGVGNRNAYSDAIMLDETPGAPGLTGDVPARQSRRISGSPHSSYARKLDNSRSMAHE
jgi:hypothetical protein